MSTVFRVEKTANYTVMSNTHLKDRRLSYPNIVVLECLANYFGVTTDYLLGKPFLSEQECRFLKFVSHLEILTELHYKNILPTELYVLCRNALVADFI